MSGRVPPGRRQGGAARGAAPESGGLCPLCRHVKRQRSDRGSTFLLCQLAKRDPGLPRYPPQPRLVCWGFER